MMTGRFGRSPVWDVAYRLRDRCSELAITLSWQLFTSLKDWGERWPAKQDNFAAGLILTAATNPIVERAVGRCLADLARLGRPVLWGVIGQRVRWQSRFALTPNGWPPELISPDPFEYARLGVAYDTPEFRPRFDPILYSPEPDFRIGDWGLWWWEARFFHWETRDDGTHTLLFGYMPDD
jgi:hypothetical protein